MSKTNQEYKTKISQMTFDQLLDEFEYAIELKTDPMGPAPPDDMVDIIRKEIENKIIKEKSK